MITLGKIFTSWTSKVQKNTKNTQYAYKVHNKEKIGQKKNHCIGRFDEIILIVLAFWLLNFTFV